MTAPTAPGCPPHGATHLGADGRFYCLAGPPDGAWGMWDAGSWANIPACAALYATLWRLTPTACPRYGTSHQLLQSERAPLVASHTSHAANQDQTIYLDLDGVMADFDLAFPFIFGLDHRSLADDDMWARINSHPSFFRDLPPMPGAIAFFRSIEHLDPIILTACPKSNYAHVAGQKREWVREHLSATCTVLPVMGGRHKALFMHREGDVLIDDMPKNCDAWSVAGGTAILHAGDWDATNAALRDALAGAHVAAAGP